jgi:hypothetical protein
MLLQMNTECCLSKTCATFLLSNLKKSPHTVWKIKISGQSEIELFFQQRV